MKSENVREINTKCQVCNREIPDGAAYYQHPKYGIVCEYCEPFKDGGVEVPDNE